MPKTYGYKSVLPDEDADRKDVVGSLLNRLPVYERERYVRQLMEHEQTLADAWRRYPNALTRADLSDACTASYRPCCDGDERLAFALYRVEMTDQSLQEAAIPRPPRGQLTMF